MNANDTRARLAAALQTIAEQATLALATLTDLTDADLMNATNDRTARELENAAEVLTDTAALLR